MAKRNSSELLPAIQIYDGPSWRVLRKYLKDISPASDPLDVYGLSAKYGLIPADQKIEQYDEILTEDRAQDIQQEVQSTFRNLVGRNYHEIGIALTKKYLQTFGDWEAVVPELTKVTLISGPMGERLGRLKAWLEKRDYIRKINRTRIKAPSKYSATAKIKGMEIKFTKEEVIRMARSAFDHVSNEHEKFRNWYVLIDGRRVSTKWLVSILSGMPTTEFSASGSRKVLLDLGFDIEFMKQGIDKSLDS